MLHVHETRKFPDDFLWGVATSAHQVEGGNTRNDWWRFEQRPGATKDEAIEAYGWPTGQSQSGTKEILSYPQGRITLENGRVEKVDFSTSMPWPAPAA